MNIFSFLAGPVMEIVNKLIPDKEKQAEIQLELIKLQDSKEARELEASIRMSQNQAEINKEEAAHASIWVAGWRPFIGWVCGAGLALQFIVFPMVFWIGQLADIAIIMPQLPFEMIMTMLGGMLGIGTLHTYEKVKGVVKGAS